MPFKYPKSPFRPFTSLAAFALIVLYSPRVLIAQEWDEDRKRAVEKSWTPAEPEPKRNIGGANSGDLDELLTIDDFHGRKFRMDLSGKTLFNPHDDNWRPVLPVREDALKYLDEAEALYNEGLQGEALRLWKTVAAMNLIEDRSASDLEAVRKAVRRINDLKAKTSYFNMLDEKTEPVVFYDGKLGQTYLVSLDQRIRLVLPGSWKFYRQIEPEGSPSTRRYLIYLRHAEFTLTAAYDLFPSYRFMDMSEWIRIWDDRRSMTRQIRYANGFLRATDDQLPECESESAVNCKSYYTSIGRYSFYEHFRLSGSAGLYLDLRHAEGKKPAAAQVFRYILERMKF
jgi:hypothetical protein